METELTAQEDELAPVAEEEIFEELQPELPAAPPGDGDPLPEQIYLWEEVSEPIPEPVAVPQPRVETVTTARTAVQPAVSAPQNARIHAQEILQSASLQQIQEILRTLQVLQSQDPTRIPPTGNTPITENHF